MDVRTPAEPDLPELEELERIVGMASANQRHPGVPGGIVAFEEILEEPQEGRAVLITDPDDGALGLLVGGGIDRQQEPLRPPRGLAVCGHLLERVELQRERSICCLKHQDDTQRLQFLERQLVIIDCRAFGLCLVERTLKVAAELAAVGSSFDITNTRVPAATTVKVTVFGAIGDTQMRQRRCRLTHRRLLDGLAARRSGQPS